MANERLDYVAGYRHEIDYALADGEGPILRKIRDRLSTQILTPADELAVHMLDEQVVASVIELGDDIAEYLIADVDTQPQDKWWWHLGKIRNKTFPVESLPAYLQAVYNETAQ